MAAMTALLDSLPNGAHVIFPQDCYAGLRVLATEFLPQRGVTVSAVDTGEPDAVRAAITPNTRCLWLETPSNPQLRICDIAALSTLAHAHGIRVACDNTFATPLLQQPLRLGADVVMHSTTKYFGGHSDVLGGALVFAQRDAQFDTVAHRRHITGGVPSPFNVWLTLRGLRSLPARMAWHCGNARVVAKFLAQHPRVEAVHWPGLPTHPNHAVAARQMRDFGGMLSVRIRGGRDAALAVAAKMKLFTNATSLGGCESLIEHRASVEGAHPVSPENLLRLSVGLEHADDLVADLAQALA
jgi:cystathionine gamma-synthase